MSHEKCGTLSMYVCGIRSQRNKKCLERVSRMVVKRRYWLQLSLWKSRKIFAECQISCFNKQWLHCRKWQSINTTKHKAITGKWHGCHFKKQENWKYSKASDRENICSIFWSEFGCCEGCYNAWAGMQSSCLRLYFNFHFKK